MPGASDIVTSQLHAVSDRIADLARAAGRSPESIRVIAVSKSHSLEKIEAAITARQCEFGESTVQEALPKIEHFHDRPLTWHFIGHLQSNKAKFVPGTFAWLHSLDTSALAARLERVAAERGATLNTLIEVNVSRDPRKYGVAPERVEQLVESLLHAQLTRVLLRGLMTVGPTTANRNAIRACFARLRKLGETCRTRFAMPQFTELSMGMSADYAEAIAEGATMIRLGTAVFGERVYRGEVITRD